MTSAYKSFKSNVEKSITQSSVFMKRTRLDNMLEQAVSFPMVAVYAGAGYGKTRTVYSFLKEQSAYITWMQLSDSDNDIDCFWKKYTDMISLTWPETASRFAKIGFPYSDEDFPRFVEIRSEVFSPHGKTIVVYDDFHLLRNPAVLHFFERDINSLPSHGTVITISRTIPKINVNSMMMSERIFTIRENDLCFTEDEVAEYFKQLKLPVTRQEVRDIYDDTHGWAFAVNLIGRSLSSNKKYDRYALAALKENVYKLIEPEISHVRNKPVWGFLLRISLIDHFTADIINNLASEDVHVSALDKLNAYIRYDHHLGIYIIHKLLIDYLRQYHDEIPDCEKCSTYNKAGIWCENNKYPAEALTYYEKAGNYDSIIRTIGQFDLQVPQDTAACAMEILDRMPEAATQSPLFPAIVIKTKMSLGLLREASESARKYADMYREYPESDDKNLRLAAIYGAWAVLRLIMSPYTNEYDFDVYFKTMREYYDKARNKVPVVVSYNSVGPYALMVGTNRAGAPEEFADALRRAIPHSVHAFKGNMHGYDDLVRGELFLCRRNLNDAEQSLSLALNKARSAGQYDIQSRALQYLMYLAFARGKIDMVNKLFKQVEELLEHSSYAARYEAYDIVCGFYYLTLGQPEQVPERVKSDFEKYAHPSFMENYTNRVRALYRYQTGQYNTLLAYLESERGKQTLLLAKIELSVIEALTLYKLGRKNEAMAAFSEAYALAEPNKIIVLFTRYSKDMRTLTVAALKDAKCTIPKDWLESINRTSSAYAKRLAYMISEINKASSYESTVSLTDRELKVLQDLFQGLSRREIAVSQNISINTVKMVINSIYNKLCVSSMHSAIRVAIKQNLI